jgi:hypothetical protein
VISAGCDQRLSPSVSTVIKNAGGWRVTVLFIKKDEGTLPANNKQTNNKQKRLLVEKLVDKAHCT